MEQLSPRPENWPFGEVEYPPCTAERSDGYACFELFVPRDESSGGSCCPACTQRCDWPRPRAINVLHAANMRDNARKNIADGNPSVGDYRWAEYHLACALLSIDAAEAALDTIAHGVAQGRARMRAGERS